MPDPKSDSYHRYRDGIVRRHIICSGRYLSELWLKQFEPGVDNPFLLKHSRTFTSPEIPCFVKFSVPILGTQTIYDGGTIRVGPYFITLGEGKVTYNLPGIGTGELGEPQTIQWGSYFIEFHPGQKSQTRTYIPWLSEDSIVYGGGENPLCRGGIAMATFAVEYMVKHDPTSLRYAEHLLRYFEQSEMEDSSCKKTGFFLRCDHISNLSGQMGLHASVDEIVGMVLGLYYFYLATDHTGHRARIRNLIERFGFFLQRNGYILLSPEKPPTLHRGFGAPYLFQWAFQQALQRTTGNRFEPRKEDYNSTSEKLYEAYLNSDSRILFGASKWELLGIMYLWAKTSKIDEGQGNRWIQALRDSISSTVAESDYLRFAFVSMLPEAIGEVAGTVFSAVQSRLDFGFLSSAFYRYLLTICIQEKIVWFRNTENWWNNAMILHTLHYALDREVTNVNNDRGSAIQVAEAANAMIKVILCGERLPKPSILPPGWELGSPDDDLYGATVVKGLLSQFISTRNMKCSPLPEECGPSAAMLQYSYTDRVNRAIDRRSRLWDELPASELEKVRTGEWQAPIRWHNSDNDAKAKKGTDFCWEHWKGNEAESNRILGWGARTHQGATGLVVDPNIREILRRGVDVIFEAGGLDFLFPRILMSYWWNEPVDFKDIKAPLLKAITCLPCQVDGRYRKAICRRKTGDWLLFSSTMRKG